MNKADLIETITKDKDAGFASKASAEKAVNAVLEGVKKGLKKDRTVQVIGFGTFAVRKRKPRQGRNPKTGEAISIPASKTVSFRASKGFRDTLP